MRGELETGTDCYILTPSSSDHSSTSFAFWLGCLTVGHWGPKALCLPLALNSAYYPQLTPTATDSNRLCPGYNLFDAHLLPLFFRLFTQVHLLIDGSVEGQYVTIHRQPHCRGVRPPSANECSVYISKQSGSEGSILELWGMWSTHSLPLIQGPLWPGVVAYNRVLSMGQIDLVDV